MKHTDIAALVVTVQPCAVRKRSTPSENAPTKRGGLTGPWAMVIRQSGTSHEISKKHTLMRGYPPQPIDVLRPSVNPVVELEAKDGQQPQSYPNVRTIFTAPANRRDMSLASRRRHQQATGRERTPDPCVRPRTKHAPWSRRPDSNRGTGLCRYKSGFDRSTQPGRKVVTSR